MKWIKSIKWGYILSLLLIVHGVSGMILALVADPHAHSMDEYWTTIIAGFAIYRTRLAVDRTPPCP